MQFDPVELGMDSCLPGIRRHHACKVHFADYMKIHNSSPSKTTCPHGTRTDQCKECVPIDRMLSGHQFCHICCSKQLCNTRRLQETPICAECEETECRRIEHITVDMLLAKIEHPPSLRNDVIVGGPSCDSGRRRPDLAWIGKDRVIKVGIDENGGHFGRDPVCEMAKMHDQFVSWQKQLGNVVVFYLKLNPSEFDGRKISLADRTSSVSKRINQLLVQDLGEFSTLVPHVEYWYYHSKCEFQIRAVREHPDSFILSAVNV